MVRGEDVKDEMSRNLQRKPGCGKNCRVIKLEDGMEAEKCRVEKRRSNWTGQDWSESAIDGKSKAERKQKSREMRFFLS